MSHSIQEIIDNQEKNKDLIISWYKNEIKTTRESLQSIKSSDDFIKKEKKKLQTKIKKYNLVKRFEKLFFMHSTRNKDYYIWWDDKLQEALILKYDKK